MSIGVTLAPVISSRVRIPIPTYFLSNSILLPQREIPSPVQKQHPFRRAPFPGAFCDGCDEYDKIF